MNVSYFALGIRTVKNFSIEDKLGAIIDEIIYSENSEFNEKILTEVRENHNTKMLYDPTGRNKFTITPRDFIFEHYVEHDFNKEFDKFVDNYISVITKQVFKKFNIRNIIRFGVLFKAELEEKDQLLLDISQTIKKYKGDNDSLSLRFNVISKKPLKIGQIVTEDYDNEIITYDKPDSENPFSLAVDYQKYFKPELNIIEDATQDFGTFCKFNLTNYTKTYLQTK